MARPDPAGAVGAAAATAVVAAAAAARRPGRSSTAVYLAAARPPLLAAGAAAAAALAVLGRRRWATVVLVATAVSWASRPRPHRRGSPAGSGQPLRLFCANVWSGATDLAALAGEIGAAGADVVIAQEVTPRHLQWLREHGTLDGLPFGVVTADPGHRGMGLWCRYPVTGAQWVDAGGEQQLRCWVTVPDGTSLRLYAVHAPAPVPNKLARWHEALAQLGEDAAGELAAHEMPVVLAGDFNATVDHRPFRRLLRTGLRDAAVERAQGWRMTWPYRRWGLPALFRLDHVLVSDGVQVATYRLGRDVGSDHRPMVVDLVVGRRAT